ncbi:MAG TPA: hypothetical protein VLZ84_11015 [Asticcacaulis sp.]|nr:hypothetical protein [Asticcacaulis sp.]
MAQEVNMNVRVDAELWKRFERAAELSRQVPDDLLKSLMCDYADRHLLASSSSAKDIVYEDDSNLQIDLEDFLLMPMKA